MTPGKFNWFLHAMLLLQIQHVIKKQKEKDSTADNGKNSSENEVNV